MEPVQPEEALSGHDSSVVSGCGDGLGKPYRAFELPGGISLRPDEATEATANQSNKACRRCMKNFMGLTSTRSA